MMATVRQVTHVVLFEKIGRDNIEALNDKLIEDARELVA